MAWPEPLAPLTDRQVAMLPDTLTMLHLVANNALDATYDQSPGNDDQATACLIVFPQDLWTHDLCRRSMSARRSSRTAPTEWQVLVDLFPYDTWALDYDDTDHTN